MTEQETLAAILETLVEIRDELKKQSSAISEQNVGLDPTPWPFKLAVESSTWADADGNGLIYGKDFILAENPANIPPALSTAFWTVNGPKSSVAKKLSWEEYLNTLPNGLHKTAVQDFVKSLPYRVSKSAQ